MITLYKVVRDHVNTACRFYGGTPPQRNFDLRAILAAFVLNAGGFGIVNTSMAAVAFAVPRPSVNNAQTPLKSEDADLLKAAGLTPQ